ncbi:uncharacterized protein DNG_09987 [Cephalotrichum gorgonifer]|uniref:Uncharacterized protein n=1 Tax=Cephalotrichum gorgonifer TaxID=2041049 RepID=A0AAE8N8D4_9PEZI|nr:uncharacterized protein DNG_09987 [Cephalotrichum gorgonifer]
MAASRPPPRRNVWPGFKLRHRKTPPETKLAGRAPVLRTARRGGNKKGGEKNKNKEKEKEGGGDKSKEEDEGEKDAKNHQMAQPWRSGSSEGDKIRVQSRRVKKH